MEWLIRTSDAKAALASSRFFIFIFIFLPKGYQLAHVTIRRFLLLPRLTPLLYIFERVIFCRYLWNFLRTVLTLGTTSRNKIYLII
jgi:hypothetical protein